MLIHNVDAAINAWLGVSGQAIAIATWETLYMVISSGLLALLFGLPLGVLLVITRHGSLQQQRITHRIVESITNVVRSVPFIILLVAVVPLTRWLAGTAIGASAAIIPLTIAAIPFVARLMENTFSEVNPGLIEAGLAMGANTKQLVKKILIAESLPGIIRSTTVTIITLVGYSAMAGAVGGGGLGQMAINYGYQRFNMKITLVTVIILVLLVQLIQSIGNSLAKRVSH